MDKNNYTIIPIMGAQRLPGPWTSFLFWAPSYIFIGHIPKKVGHPGSRWCRAQRFECSGKAESLRVEGVGALRVPGPSSGT